jgi:hypothetical protein
MAGRLARIIIPPSPALLFFSSPQAHTQAHFGIPALHKLLSTHIHSTNSQVHTEILLLFHILSLRSSHYQDATISTLRLKSDY